MVNPRIQTVCESTEDKQNTLCSCILLILGEQLLLGDLGFVVRLDILIQDT